MGIIRIQNYTRSVHALEAVEGWRVEDWVSRPHPARDDEEAKLDDVPEVSDASRPSCQMIYSQDLDGLTVKPGRAA